VNDDLDRAKAQRIENVRDFPQCLFVRVVIALPLQVAHI
jgi:hypothetical protein